MLSLVIQFGYIIVYYDNKQVFKREGLILLFFLYVMKFNITMIERRGELLLVNDYMGGMKQMQDIYKRERERASGRVEIN